MLVKVSSILTNKRIRKNLGDLDSLASSIADVGLLHPIVIKPNMELVAGYRRLMAVKTILGLAEIDATIVDNITDTLTELKAERDENVCRLDFTPSEAVEMGRAIEPLERVQGENNRINGSGRPKKGEKFTPISDGSKSLDRVAAAVGMSRPTYQKAKAVMEAVEANPAISFLAEEMDKTGNVSKAHRKMKKQIEQEQAEKNIVDSGDGWNITDEQDVISCDVLITDPPYNILSESWDNIDNFELFTREWLTRWNNCNARFFVSFWSQEYLFSGKTWFDECLTNYEFQQLLIWHYPNNKSPQSRQKFKQTYEPIFFYRRKGCVDEVRIDSSQWGNEANDFDCLIAAVPQTNYNEVDYKEHPAQKPLKVMRWLVLNLSKIGDLIADPFCGSSTTGIAAIQLKRRFHGIETNYIELAKKRMSQWGAGNVND